MRWRAMTVMYLCKHSFHYLTRIYCQMGYEKHSRRAVTSLEIYDLTSCRHNRWRYSKWISSRQFANLRWYFLHRSSTQWSIHPYIYYLRKNLEVQSNIDNISIRKVRDYICIVSKILLSFLKKFKTFI
jgi:hypothetical protein